MDMDWTTRRATPLERLMAVVERIRAARSIARGRLAAAAAAAERSLLLAGPSFRGHLLLGRIYLRQGRFDRARGELAQARFLDPRQFAAKAAIEDMLLELAGRVATGGESDARSRPIVVTRQTRPSAKPPMPRMPPTTPENGGIRDDFGSAQERAKFRDLPPLTAGDSPAIDWDASTGLFDR
jgi:tetratricopeptide (TPR) repeat protein